MTDHIVTSQVVFMSGVAGIITVIGLLFIAFCLTSRQTN